MVFTPTSKAELKSALDEYTKTANIYFPYNYDGGPNGKPNTWDVSLVTDMSNLCSDNLSYTGVLEVFPDISTWDTSNVTNMSGMFKNIRLGGGKKFTLSLATKQVTVNGTTYTAWDVSKVQNMSSMFQSIFVGYIDFSNWDVSSVQNMSSMFENVELST